MDTERSADLPPGYDDEDPYANIDIERFDPWWRENIDLFRDHNMRPYRPPQFIDGAHTPPILKRLKDEFGVSIRFRVLDPQAHNDWEIRVDGDAVTTVERYRDDGGFSVYNMESQVFEQVVRDFLTS